MAVYTSYGKLFIPIVRAIVLLVDNSDKGWEFIFAQ